MSNSKATQRPQTKGKNEGRLSYEEYSIENGVMNVWEEGNWIYTQTVYHNGITKEVKHLKERPIKAQKIEWREF